MQQVFISYKREDRSRCENIANKLSALKLNVWYDVDLRAGSRFDREIEEHVNAADAILVLWSPLSVDSNWVRDEAGIGLEKRILVAAKLAPCSLPIGFRSVHAIDLFEADFPNDDAAWRKILESLGRLCRRKDIEDWAKLEQQATAVQLAAWIATHPDSPATLFLDVDARLRAVSKADEERAEEERHARWRRAIEALDRSSSSAVKAFRERWPDHPEDEALALSLPALELAEQQQDERDAFERLDKTSSIAIRDFLLTRPNHPKAGFLREFLRKVEETERQVLAEQRAARPRLAEVNEGRASFQTRRALVAGVGVLTAGSALVAAGLFSQRPFLRGAFPAVSAAPGADHFVRPLARLRGHQSDVTDCRFSANGEKVVTASSDLTGRVWSADTGLELAVLQGHERGLVEASFSPTGQRILTRSGDDTWRLWDAASGDEVIAQRWGADQQAIVRFSPNGARVVAHEGKEARLWDPTSGRLISSLQGHQADVTSVVFSADGRRLATTSWDQTSRLWDAQSGDVLGLLTGHESTVLGATFSPDGRFIVTASWDATARLYETNTGDQIGLLTHDNAVRLADFSPDGARLLTVTDDAVAQMWSVSDGLKLFSLTERHGEDGARITKAEFSSIGTRVLIQDSRSNAWLWDAESARKLTVMRGQSGATFSQDGQFVLTRQAFGSSVHLWDAGDGRRLAALHGHGWNVSKASIRADSSRIVTSSYDSAVWLWSVVSAV